MTSREYIDTLNLAKIRTARLVLSEVLPGGDDHDADYKAVLKVIERWEARLMGLVEVPRDERRASRD